MSSREERVKKRKRRKQNKEFAKAQENYSSEKGKRSQKIAQKENKDHYHNRVKFIDYCKDKNVLIIGNSNNMIRKPHREEVDSYDVVVRMSKGALKPENYEFLGTKTSLWVLAKGHLSYLARESGEDFFRSEFFGFIYGRRIHDHLGKQKLAKKIRDRLFVMETPRSRLKGIKRTGIPVPSTGLAAIDFFMEHVSEARSINLMGFDFFSCGPKHDGDRAKSFYESCGIYRNHDSELEKEYILGLQEQGKLKVLEF